MTVTASSLCRESRFDGCAAWLRHLAMVLLAAVIAFATFLAERHWGFGLADESYLWYGTQRLLQGEVPVRDFMSYDLGRYALAGAWMWLEGDSGILALRDLLGLVTVVGVVLASMLVVRAKRLDGESAWRIVPVALLFALWMAPRYKVFDLTASIVLVAGISWMLARPNRARFFGLGLLIGLLAVLGRNHGVYAVMATGLACAWLIRHGELPCWWRAFGSLLAGLALGYAPVWVGMLLIHGFVAAMWQSVLLMFYQGATNLPLPVPWPWKSLSASHPDIGTLIAGCFFVGLLMFDVTGVLLLSLRKRSAWMSPVFIAAVCTSIPYTHYAFSRANISHLSHGVMPMLIGLLAACNGIQSQTARRYFLPPLLLALSMPTALRLHPRYDALQYGDHWRRVSIGADALMLSPQEASSVDLIEHLRSTNHAQGPVFFAPLWPGAYSLYEQRSPVWEILPLVMRPIALQEEEIARLRAARISMAVILDTSIDGRDVLRYRNNHSLIFDYLSRCLTLRPPSLESPLVLVFDGPLHCN
ncbi:hypothetical protein [Rhodanobacter sp. MP7CTX1]|uniref:hypothetical protein n=1 Tax=Rhodanobacter sp. MP7CTX1 TaxID=2723084 RepID=UPI00160F1933|nr:hypothetical protein [Rhodanobacter sp. MP7CTX1]MBB6188094.1 hypothetical protein [Rhodanobacter sp. MP7CTX1]